MKKTFSIFLAVMVLMSFSSFASAFDKKLEARSVSSGVYEDGNFNPKEDSFEAVYIVDEARDKIVLKEIISNNREGRYQVGDVYEITNTLESEGPSALLVSKNKKGQEIITAVRDSGLGASETIIIGKNFYQYSKAENGKFYLEYGEVQEKFGN